MWRFISQSGPRNLMFPFLLAILLVVAGSLSTVLFFLAAIFLVFLNPAIGVRDLIRETAAALGKLPLLWLYPAYVLLVFLTAMAGANRIEGLEFTGSYVQFLVIIPMTVGLVSITPTANFAGIFSRGFRFAVLAGFGFAAYQATEYGLRPEGWSSNALVFGTVCLVGAGLSVLVWPEDKHWAVGVGIVSLVAGVSAAILTGSRGLMLAAGLLIPAVVIHAATGRFGWRKILASGSLAILLVIILTAVLSVSFGVNRIFERKITAPVENLLRGEVPDRSINIRMDMQISGFHAFLENPLTGHGIQNVTRVANRQANRGDNAKDISVYSHLHNDFLTHAVAGGAALFILFVILLFLPVIIASKIKNEDLKHPMLGFSIVFSIVYSGMALTNLVFRHDILMTLYSAGMVFLVAMRLQELKGAEEVSIPDFNMVARGKAENTHGPDGSG